MRIGLVGCGKKKLDRAAPARELYTGPLFKAALRYAEATCDRVFVLSAKHGLLDLDTVVEPYDLRLADLGDEGLEVWSRRVEAALICRVSGSVDEVVALAGRDYCAALTLPDGWALTEPLEGKGLIERSRWLRANTPSAVRADTSAGDAKQLAAEILDWEAQFGPTSDDDTCEVAGEDMARWARMARAIVGGQA